MTSTPRSRGRARRVSLSLIPGLSAALAVAVLLPCARGQGFGPDPFRPYNSQYDPFVYPVLPGPYDAGGNTALNTQGIRGANQFQRYLNELGVTGGRGGPGMPYYRANRIYDKEFKREYQPNRLADQSFEATQQNISEMYFRYLREKDPKKRAQLLREYQRAQARSSRELSSPRHTVARKAADAERGQEMQDEESEPSRPGESARPPAPSVGRRGSATGRLRPPPPSDDESADEQNKGANPLTRPAPPPVSGAVGSSRSRAGTKPSEVLDRALRMDREEKALRSPSPLTTPRRLTRPVRPAPPNPSSPR